MTRLRSLLLTLVLAACFAPGAVVLQPMKPQTAGNGLDAAQPLLDAGNYKEALALFAREAEAGNAAALFGLGWMHQQGYGVAASPVVAQTFYEQAAQRGSVPAMFNLAALLHATAHPDARQWLEKAAKAGSGRAALALGQDLQAGKSETEQQAGLDWLRKAGAAEDTRDEAALALAAALDPKATDTGAAGKEARAVLKAAADRGYAPAAIALAGALVREKETAAQGLQLLQNAVASGSAQAGFLLGQLHFAGRGVPADAKKAADLWRAAAAAGSGDAANELASLYQQGKGVEQDDAQAYQWFVKGAEAGSAIAQFNVGVLLETGRGVAKDPAAACQWYYRSARAGYPVAQNRLALRYQDGQGLMQDAVAARSWLREAVSRQYEPAMLNYAAMLAAGEGGPTDVVGALQIYQHLAGKGRPEALHAIGTMCESGLGGVPDPARAFALYRLAADKHTPSRERVDILTRALPADTRARAEAYVKDPATLFPPPPGAEGKK